MSIRSAERMNIIPVLEPKDLTTTATKTAYVDLDLANWVTFVVSLGSISSAGATCDSVVLTVECSSVAGTSGTAIGFSYRLSSALATNAWGVSTAGTSDGVTFGPAIDNMDICIDVDPGLLPQRSELYRWVYLALVPGSTATLAAEYGAG